MGRHVITNKLLISGWIEVESQNKLHMPKNKQNKKKTHLHISKAKILRRKQYIANKCIADTGVNKHGWITVRTNVNWQQTDLKEFNLK